MQFITQPTPLAPEAIDDRVANVLEAGTNVTLDYDDAANVLTISATPGGGGSTYTDEQAQDAVGGIVTDSATIDFLYNDATPSISGFVKYASITEPMLSLTDNTTQNSSATRHGLLPKLSNNTTHFLRGDGTWVVPPTGATYTDEQAQDAAAAMLTAGANISLSYNDASNLLTISTTALDTEAVQDTVAAMLIAGTNITLSYNDAANTLTINSTAGGGGTDAEAVQDIVGAMLVAGTNVTLNYNDVANTLTINTTVSGGAPTDAEYITSTTNATLSAERVLTDTATITWDRSTAGQVKANAVGAAISTDTEAVQDIVGALFLDTATIDFVYNDAFGNMTANVKDNSITETKISLSSVTTNNATNVQHGFLPQLSMDTNQFLRGDGTWTTPVAAPDTEATQDIVGAMLQDSSSIDFQYFDASNIVMADIKDACITEAKMSLSDVTAQNVNTARHGLVPKAPNDATKYLDGTGQWSTPQPESRFLLLGV